MREYLGDGVYADIIHGDLVLTSEDGIRATNRIVLEPDVYRALVQYMTPAPGVSTDCVNCGCMVVNHLASGATRLRLKCMSCDHCEGYVAPIAA